MRTAVVASYAADVDLVRVELADDPTVDITTTGRHTGLARRIEIWMLVADPGLVVHLKRHAHVDLAARATPVVDAVTRRHVLDHLNATWYRAQQPLDVLVDASPMVEVVFEGDNT